MIQHLFRSVGCVLLALLLGVSCSGKQQPQEQEIPSPSDSTTLFDDSTAAA